MRIAIVNDVRAASEALRRVVTESTDHDVAWMATDGLEAVAMAKRDRPDLILMDWHMPGLDGLSATRQIKASPNTQLIPIVSLTAFAMEPDIAACLAAGAADHIAKPVDFDALPEIISRNLKSRREP